MNSSTIHSPLSRLGHTLGRSWVLALGLMLSAARQFSPIATDKLVDKCAPLPG